MTTKRNPPPVSKNLPRFLRAPAKIIRAARLSPVVPLNQVACSAPIFPQVPLLNNPVGYAK